MAKFEMYSYEVEVAPAAQYEMAISLLPAGFVTVGVFAVPTVNDEH
jgi:hypothetical protein